MELTEPCTAGETTCCPQPGTPRACVSNGLEPPTDVCAEPPTPPGMPPQSSSPDGTRIVVKVAPAYNGGTVAGLQYRCMIQSGATAYTLSVDAPANPTGPLTDVTFAPGSLADGGT